MYLSIIFISFLSFFVSFVFGRFLGAAGVCFFSTTCTWISLFLSIFIFYEVGLCSSMCVLKTSSWITTDSFVISWGFLFDTLSSSMLIVITSVSALVHLYSTSYMENDPHLCRFMSYLSLFTFFMIVLVTADNYLQMFVGWEGVGLVSYLLISFWNTRIQANKSAIKAMLVNRVGDIGLCLGLCGLYTLYHSLDYTVIFGCNNLFEQSLLDFFNNNISFIDFICFCIFWGAVGKSAQIGLHTWLPDAMEGPTPVSALIHAATMVTAGVFVIIRSASLFEQSPNILIVICTIGACTSFFAATSNLVQNDLKRVIAYSTCSQLGYMVFACGLSSYSVAFFHLANHAFFKALLFLGAGCIIHGICDEQDMRKMGLGQLFVFTYAFILIGSLALSGFPFLTGFYSKDTILEISVVSNNSVAGFCHLLTLMAAVCTSIYSFRLLLLAFLNSKNPYKAYVENAHEAPFNMAFPLVFLSFGAIFIGFVTKDLAIGLGSDSWGSLLSTQDPHLFIIEAEFLPAFIKHLPFIGGFFGALFSLLFISSSFSLDWKHFMFRIVGPAFCQMYTFFSSKWHFDQVYNEFISHKIMLFGYSKTFLCLDKGFIELLGPFGLSEAFGNLSRNFSGQQSGFLYHYALTFILAVSFFMAIECLTIPISSLSFPLLVYFTLFIVFYISQFSFKQNLILD